jgi:adenylate cyclase
MLECFNQGFLFYHERDFAQATAMFTSALNHKPDDAPSQLYLERCQDYALTPPEANWDGVFTMTSK